MNRCTTDMTHGAIVLTVALSFVPVVRMDAQPELGVATEAEWPLENQRSQTAANVQDFQFDRVISREVLENYLARAISMEGMLNGRGDLDDNIRMLKSIGAKFIGRSICLWGREAELLR